MESLGVVGDFSQLSAKQKDYIELRVEGAVAEGKITSSQKVYRSSLIEKAKNDELNMDDIGTLLEKQIRRKDKIEWEAKKEKQKRENREERSVIEKFRQERGFSKKELCRYVFSGRSGVESIPCDRAEEHLWFMYTEEAREARNNYFFECGVRFDERRRKKSASSGLS